MIQELGQIDQPILLDLGFQWVRQTLELRKQHFLLGPYGNLNYLRVLKIKCYRLNGPQPTNKKIKISYEGVNDFFLAVDFNTTGSAPHYSLFQKLISFKLQMLGYDFSKTPSLVGSSPPLPPDQYFCKGFIYTKSITNKWKLRFATITAEGLTIYSKSGQRRNQVVSASYFKQLWTRFDFHQGFIVLKLRHGLEKTQIAISILNFGLKVEANYLLGLYKLLVCLP